MRFLENLNDKELMSDFAEKVFEAEPVCYCQKPAKDRHRKAESRRTMTRRKAQSRMRLERQMADYRVPVMASERKYDMAHYGRFANHARIRNYVDNPEPFRVRKKDFRKEMELALAEMV